MQSTYSGMNAASGASYSDEQSEVRDDDMQLSLRTKAPIRGDNPSSKRLDMSQAPRAADARRRKRHRLHHKAPSTPDKMRNGAATKPRMTVKTTLVLKQTHFNHLGLQHVGDSSLEASGWSTFMS